MLRKVLTQSHFVLQQNAIRSNRFQISNAHLRQFSSETKEQFKFSERVCKDGCKAIDVSVQSTIEQKQDGGLEQIKRSLMASQL